MKSWNPRYVEYARAHDVTPDAHPSCVKNLFDNGLIDPTGCMTELGKRCVEKLQTHPSRLHALRVREVLK